MLNTNYSSTQRRWRRWLKRVGVKVLASSGFRILRRLNLAIWKLEVYCDINKVRKSWQTFNGVLDLFGDWACTQTNRRRSIDLINGLIHTLIILTVYTQLNGDKKWIKECILKSRQLYWKGNQALGRVNIIYKGERRRWNFKGGWEPSLSKEECHLI